MPFSKLPTVNTTVYLGPITPQMYEADKFYGYCLYTTRIPEVLKKESIKSKTLIVNLVEHEDISLGEVSLYYIGWLQGYDLSLAILKY